MKYPIELPSLSEFHHSLPVQLRFNDIDILGHLNNTVYLSLYDLGKARWMEAVNEGRVNWQRVESVIANIDCAYIKQIRFGDRISVYTRCLHVGDKSFTLQQALADDKGEIRSLCNTVMVCFDPDTHRAATVKEEWRRAVEAFEQPRNTD